MKINEVLIEGPLDFARKVGAGIAGAAQGLAGGSPVAGAQAGYQAKGAAIAQQEKIKKVTANALQKWAAHAQTIKSAGRQATAQDAVSWFTQLSGGNQPATTPTGVSPAQISPWLSKEIANYMAAKASAQPPAPAAPTPSVQPQPQQPVSTEPKPLQIGAKTKAGTQLIKVEPTTLKYKNQNYVRGGEKGEWTRFGSDKPLGANEQSFFNSEEDELMNSAGKITPSEPAQQPAQPLPDVSDFTPEERAELIRQIKQQLSQMK